jgi:hypothetical protein
MNRSSSRVEFASCAPSDDVTAFEVGVFPGVEAVSHSGIQCHFHLEPPSFFVVVAHPSNCRRMSGAMRKKVAENDNDVSRAPQNLRKSHSS